MEEIEAVLLLGKNSFVEQWGRSIDAMYTLYKQASVDRNHLFLLQHYKRNLAVFFAEKWCSKARGRLANRIGLGYLFSAEKNVSI